MGNRHVIFIHGVGAQIPGYSKALWRQLWEGQNPGDAQRHEVFYYNVFQPARAMTKPAQLPSRGELRKLIAGRIGGSKFRGAVDRVSLEALVDTVSEVLRFCLDTGVREQVIEKFKRCLRSEVIKPAVQQGVSPADLKITILSHSLGTVVGYLGCHEALLDPKLGLNAGVRFKNLYTLASPLELISWVARETGLGIEHVTPELSRPVLLNAPANTGKGNIVAWWSYRHKSDPVASLIPLPVRLLDNRDVAPYLFAKVNCGSIHSFSNYIAQAKSGIIANI